MILEKVLPLIFIFLLGYFLKYKKILSKKDTTFLSKALIMVVLPSLGIKIFSSVELKKELLLLPISAAIFLTCMLVIGYIITRFIDVKDITKKTFIMFFPTIEGGGVGYVFMLAAFGELGLSRIVIFDIVQIIFLFTFINFLASYFGKNTSSIKESIIKILKMPIIWGLVTGILLNITNINLALLDNTIIMISDSAIFLLMLLIGLEFEPKIKGMKLPTYTILTKTVIGTVLGFLLTYLFGFQGIERIAVIAACSLPPSMMSIIFAKENALDEEYCANVLSLALPFGVIFLVVLLNFL